MTTLTTEQAQQIEEALKLAIRTSYSEHNNIKFEASIATIRAARAQEQAEQEPVIDYERLNALREGEQNKAEDDYFNARPENDTPTLRKMFCQGFERGFHKGIKYAAPVEPVKQEPIGNISLWHNHGHQNHNVEYYGTLPDGFHQLYAAPVRTKDLTDDEIAALFQFDDYDFASAVIAADRKLNGVK